MKFEITKKFMVISAEDKGNVTLYQLLDGAKTFTAIGEKNSGLRHKDDVEATIEVTTKSERFELKNGEIQFVETARFFISKVKKIEEEK